MAWARANLSAIERCKEWMHRKREVLTLTGVASANRRIEIEFGIPAALQPKGYDHARAPVLLARVPKRRSGAVDVTDGTGGQIATLTSEEAQQLSLDILCARAEKLLAEAHLTDEPVGGQAGIWARLREDIEQLRWPERSSGGSNGSDALETWWSLLARDDLFRAMFVATRTHDAVIAEISTANADRRIVRIVCNAIFEQRQDVRETPGVRRLARPRRVARRGLLALSESVGWKESRLLIDTPGLEAPCPYEFDIEVPDGVDLTYVVLQERSESGLDVAATPGDRFGRVSHRALEPSATLRLLLRMRPTLSYPAAVLFTAILAAGILTAGWLRLRNLADAPDASAAILLALPALFTAAVAQPVRASPAASMVLGARVVLLACGLLTYFAAVMLVLFSLDAGGRYSGTTPSLRLFWVIDMIVCWLLVAILLWPLIGPVIAARRRT